MYDLSQKSIFLACLEANSPAEREAILVEACAGNHALKAQVVALLDAHDRVDNLLDEAPPGVRADDGSSPGASGLNAPHSAPVPSSPLETLDSATLTEHAGVVIGPYRLMEEIGEGGMGLVFVAEQQKPIRRKVALKVIKPGMDTRDVIARFEAERQALALMEHPNIARVLDAGTTASGRPYFVMELVRGIPITDFCDQSQLTPHQRLELFVDVCHAVQHAHQKGIIHRDIKPSNVLVTLHDGTPVVKVIDFGVAKAVGQHLTDKTIYTCFAQMIGTPLYISPEQAEMSGLDIDTRSDIYSLGVLLYELLTGTTPFDRDRLHSASIDEMRRILREEEPPTPSTRLTTMGQALITVSAKRGIDPRKLSSLVRGDLDWIVVKAMEKDRSRRYETASAFAADIRRLMNNEPVEARPPSARYRFGKFARRNKVILTTALLVGITLVLGTAVSAWQAVRAMSAQAEADQLREKAEDFAERMKAANVLLASARAHADNGRWALAHADYLQAAARLQPDHYLVWSERGRLYVRLGLWKQAASDFSRAFDLGATASSPEWQGIPQLFLYVGNEQGHREACEQLLKQFEHSSDIFSTFSLVRACVVSPAQIADSGDLADRVEKLLLMSPEFPPGFGGQRKPAGAAPRGGARPAGGTGFAFGMPRGVGDYFAGLANYRAGRYDLAIERLRESLTVDERWRAREIGYPALAMACYRAGQTSEATSALAAAKKALDGWTDEMLQGTVGVMPGPWWDWVECLVLYREASVLITGSAPPDDPRLRTIELRALAAIEPGAA